MCGRYHFNPDASADLAEITRVLNGQIKTGEIFPTNSVAVLMEAGEEIAPAAMVWGYPRFGGRSGSIINARSETALDRPMFRKSVLERRCVIPTTGFYEWGGEQGKKQKYLFRRPGETALYLAGLWNEFAGERKCVILTTAANASMDGIHDRMPVVVSKEMITAWVKYADGAVSLLGEVPPALEHREA